MSGSEQSSVPSPSLSPSSIDPLQLSSMPLHVSATGVPGVHVCEKPPAQFCTVRWQAPTPQLVDPSPSSTDPSQSSSMPLQVSVPGLPGEHVCGTPPEQFCTVLWQAPTPQVVDPSASARERVV